MQYWGRFADFADFPISVAILDVGLNPSLRKIGIKLGLSPAAKIPAAANGVHCSDCTVQYCRSVF